MPTRAVVAAFVRRGVGPLIASVTLATAMVACATTDSSRISSPSPSSQAKMPEFTGPFAAEYREAWDRSTNESVKRIVEDEVISEQEWSQVMQSLKTCLEAEGITVTEYREDGSYDALVGDLHGEAANEELGRCEIASGEAWLGYLYRSQTDNPQNIPEPELMADCLKRNSAVAPSYTAEQYAEDVEDVSFPYVDAEGPAIFESCNVDHTYGR